MDNNSTIPNEIRAVLELHLGKNFADIAKNDQIDILNKKRKRYWIMIAANLFALIFFSYSFIAGITEINEYIYYILGVVFVLNLLLIFYQRKQIGIAIDFLRKN